MAQHMTSRELHWTVRGQEHVVRIEDAKGHGRFHMEGRSVPYRILGPDRIEVDGKVHRFYSVRDRNTCTVWIDGRTFHLERSDKRLAAETVQGPASGDIRALMPGKLLRLEVAVGDTVEEKQTVAIMESMKMESSLLAPKAGRVVEIRCAAWG
jgi:acetyl/propionyl-CoA carboxylase alpha subunit